ncbi:3-hydroxyisobutyryl-CoA hydrolase, mitochondrial-like [Bradysia coprophila]|uniref:3-hydroxyisobutyryl-CoA hydrolase, mitochondrial-like n=1 Tax=Bradysia coprophila TaxID=38358 RepID=UPI00187DB3B5|nr:3-hydroxyisobutyryl-CoA hydrolase, mitochondrial-like [Bradysia coprophila]
MSVKFLNYFDYGSAGVIQLNRPEAMNAFNGEMLRNSYELLSKTENRNEIIIIKGTRKVFCVGGDLKELPYLPVAETSSVYTDIYGIYDLIANSPKHFVALIDGLAIGGASIYSQPAEYRIVTEKTVMFMPETTIGYYNDVGSSHFLSRLGNHFGIYMGMTGIKVKGYDLKTVGLASHFVESHKLAELEKTLIKCKDRKDVDTALSHFSSDVETRPNALDEILPRINKCFDGATVEEIFANLQSDGSDWAIKTLNTLKKNSPTSLKVAHRAITTGRNLSMRDCLKMELRISVNFVGVGDFREGVRAILVDKDFKPQWSKNSIYEVTKEDVDRFFKSIPELYELRFRNRVASRL